MSFLLEIVTPERVAFSDQVDTVLVPSDRGQLGILPHHVPLFAKLIEGEMKIVQKGKETYLAIGGGFVEVTPGKTSILVTRAVHATELNEQAIAKARQEAEHALKQKPTGEAFRTAQALLRSLLIDDKVVRRRKRVATGASR